MIKYHNVIKKERCQYLKKRTDVGMLSVYYEDNIGRTKKFIIE